MLQAESLYSLPSENLCSLSLQSAHSELDFLLSSIPIVIALSILTSQRFFLREIKKKRIKFGKYKKVYNTVKANRVSWRKKASKLEELQRMYDMIRNEGKEWEINK